jgi:hypothetical protein
MGISVIQPGGTGMRITHAMDLLFQKLPPNTHMAHHLPGLVNNLLSVAVLCDAGCKVYYPITGCEVTLNGEIMLLASQNHQRQLDHRPKNQRQ